MQVISEQEAILYRINCPSLRWKNYPATVVMFVPLFVVCEREEMRSFKPPAKPRSRLLDSLLLKQHDAYLALVLGL